MRRIELTQQRFIHLTMEGDMGLLSLKWNNHKIAFLHIIGNLRSKASYTDVTLACNGKFYPVHRLVLSTCSEYFAAIFEETSCKSPVIVLKDVDCKNLEYLLDYMYIGEVNVKQNELASLVGAAEYLKIKGLAVPDEGTLPKSNFAHKRVSSDCRSSSPSLKKKRLSRDISESSFIGSDKVKVQSSTPSEYSSRLNFENSEFNDPSFVPIKCEPQSDEDIVEDNFASVSDSNIISNSSVSHLTNRDNHAETEEDLCGKEEPVDLSEEHINQPGPSGMFENDQYQPDISGSIDSDASCSQHQDEAMKRFSPALRINPNSSLPILLPGSLQETGMSEKIFSFSKTKSVNSPARNTPTNDSSSPSRMDIQKVGGVSFQVKTEVGFRFFVCTQCDFNTYDKAKVRQHADLHTGGKPYKCDFCPYRSINRSTMVYHINMHTGEKPFGCPFCDYRTASKQRVQTHIQSKHSDQSAKRT